MGVRVSRWAKNALAITLACPVPTTPNAYAASVAPVTETSAGVNLPPPNSSPMIGVDRTAMMVAAGSVT